MKENVNEKFVQLQRNTFLISFVPTKLKLSQESLQVRSRLREIITRFLIGLES